MPKAMPKELAKVAFLFENIAGETQCCEKIVRFKCYNTQGLLSQIAL